MSRDDWIYLRRQLDRRPRSEREIIKVEYQRIFMEAYDTEPIEYRKANAGRRAANLWLLDRFGEVSSEKLWIPVPVTLDDINEAKRWHRAQGMRAKWDNAARWEGRLGEIVFDRFLADQGIEYTWLNEEHDQGEEDFRIHRIEIDIKTTGRKWKPKQHWTIGVRDDQTVASSRQFWWIVYQRTPGDTAWVIGGMPSKQFVAVSWLDKEGDQVHQDFQVGKSGSMYNVNIMVPLPWALWREKYDE